MNYSLHHHGTVSVGATFIFLLHYYNSFTEVTEMFCHLPKASCIALQFFSGSRLSQDQVLALACGLQASLWVDLFPFLAFSLIAPAPLWVLCLAILNHISSLSILFSVVKSGPLFLCFIWITLTSPKGLNFRCISSRKSWPPPELDVITYVDPITACIYPCRVDHESESVSCSAMSNTLQPHGL